MDHLSCHWSLLLSDGSQVVPSAVTVKQQLSIQQVYKKIDQMTDKLIMGQNVLYKGDKAEEIYFVGQISSDPNVFSSLVVHREDCNEGIFELKVFYTVILEDKSIKTLPADCIVRVSRPLLQDVSNY